MGERRLAVFHTGLDVGGVERALLNVVREFRHRGYAVDLVLTRDGGAFRSDVPAGAGVRTLEPGEAPGVGTLASVPSLARYLRRTRPDALLSAKVHTNLVALLARRLAGVPTHTVVSLHWMPSHQLRHVDTRKYRAAVALSKRLFPWADEIVAVSEGVRADAARTFDMPASRFSVVYNPIVTPELLADADRPVGHPWFDDGGPPVVLGVGRLHPQKNYALLVRAFDRVLDETDARLVILGDGETKPRLDALVRERGLEDRVSLPGEVRNPYPYMRRAGALAVSSVTEGLPFALVEAMACGCPVVSTNCSSGPREVLADGRYGPLVPVGDPDALAEGILSVLADPPRPATLRDRAMDFSVETIADRYEEMLFPDDRRTPVSAEQAVDDRPR